MQASQKANQDEANHFIEIDDDSPESETSTASANPLPPKNNNLIHCLPEILIG